LLTFDYVNNKDKEEIKDDDLPEDPSGVIKKETKVVDGDAR